MDKQLMRQIGSWAFIVGILIAIIIGALSGLQATNFIAWVPVEVWTIITLTLGLIVGLLNVSERETTPFLVAVIALGSAGALGAAFTSLFPYFEQLGSVIANILVNIASFAVPAGVVVALKAFYNLASEPAI